MTKGHLSRLAAPSTWRIKRKGIKWVTKPSAGAHLKKQALPLRIILRDILKYAKTTKEVKKVLNNREILVDGKIRKDEKFAVGFMDLIEIPKLKEAYRMVFDKKGKLMLKKANQKDIKICKIKNKIKVKGKTQLNLSDGKNLLIEKDTFKTGDSVVIELKSSKIKEHLPLAKESIIFLIGGKYIGEKAKIEDITNEKILFKLDSEEVFETPKKNIFVIGIKKPVIDLE